jgi:flagellar assembly protein FliH
MAALKKYMFDLDFDAVPLEPLPTEIAEPIEGEAVIEEEAPPPLTFTEFEMEEMKRLGYSEGHDAGVAEAAEVTERRHAEALAALAAGFTAVMAAQREAMDALGRDAIQLAVAVVRKIHPEMARLHGLEDISGVIRECLLQVDDATRLTVRAHPDLLEGVRAEAGRVAEEAEFDGKMQFVADPKLALGDCRVEWGNGGADRDQALLWTEIEAIVARAIDGMRGAPGTVPAAQ